MLGSVEAVEKEGNQCRLTSMYIKQHQQQQQKLSK